MNGFVLMSQQTTKQEQFKVMAQRDIKPSIKKNKEGTKDTCF